MLRKPLLTLTLALLLAVGFCYGLARLFTLRYESGDVYPPYSTMRADPLGAKGIYEAIQQLPNVETRRNFQPLKKLQPGQPITLVYLGTAHESYWTERELEEFETLMANGARAVFAFFPFDRPPMAAEARRDRDEEREKKRKRLDEEKEKEGGDKDAAKKDDDKEERSGMLSFEKVAKRLGFQFDFLPAEEKKTFDRHAFLFEPGGQLERDLSWHSALYFKDLSPEWKPLYLSETKPVLVERSYGRGSIVLASDSYFFSNEALRKERHSQLLSRIFSGPPLIIFDEEHLGVTDQPGIVQLALKYRLHGVIAGLVLIAALFVWKNSVRFIPAYPESSADGQVITGRDASQGFNNLLHRAIAPGDLLGACVEEWRRSFSRKDASVAHVEEVLAREKTRPAKQRDPVAAYREISSTLSRKTHP
ncbi:MAG: DUF4350 domain-containing protein [Chthoniobacteraceae bacterium]